MVIALDLHGPARISLHLTALALSLGGSRAVHMEIVAVLVLRVLLVEHILLGFIPTFGGIGGHLGVGCSKLADLQTLTHTALQDL